MKWFLTGLGLGTAIGMLYAPRSGAETQRQVRDMARDSMDTARRTTSAVKERVPSATSQVEDAARSAQKQVQETVQNLNLQAQQRADSTNGGEQLPTDFLGIINEWPHERLVEINGIGPVLASKIISHRPYDSPKDLVESKLLPPSAIEALRKAS